MSIWLEIGSVQLNPGTVAVPGAVAVQFVHDRSPEEERWRLVNATDPAQVAETILSAQKEGRTVLGELSCLTGTVLRIRILSSPRRA